MKATLLRDRNYDYIRQQTDSDARISALPLPPSLYLSSKPSWWGDTPWPPIGPDVAGMVNKIPAQLRYEASLATAVPEYPVPPPVSGHPAELQLLQNYPNPFNPVTTIRFGLKAPARDEVAIYGVTGALVKTLATGEAFKAGNFTRRWDGTNNGGVSVASGIYFLQMKTESFTKTKRLVLLR